MCETQVYARQLVWRSNLRQGIKMLWCLSKCCGVTRPTITQKKQTTIKSARERQYKYNTGVKNTWHYRIHEHALNPSVCTPTSVALKRATRNKNVAVRQKTKALPWFCASSDARTVPKNSEHPIPACGKKVPTGAAQKDPPEKVLAHQPSLTLARACHFNQLTSRKRTMIDAVVVDDVA